MHEQSLLLTVIVPFDLKEAVADAILARPDLTAGFSAVDVEGHGSSIQLVEAAELVCGHVRRKRFETVCSGREKAEAILDLLHQRFAGANLFYWIVPVLDSGRLT